MTQHENILFRELKDGEGSPEISKDGRKLVLWDKAGSIEQALPPGSWRIVGTTDTMGEDEWGEVVEPVEVAGGNEGRHFGYVNYDEDRQHDFNTATESGHSLLQSLGITDKCVVLKNEME
jgi:hypothetical protein